MKNYQVFGVLIWMMFALIYTQINRPSEAIPTDEPLRSDVPTGTSQLPQQDTLYRFP